MRDQLGQQFGANVLSMSHTTIIIIVYFKTLQSLLLLSQPPNRKQVQTLLWHGIFIIVLHRLLV